MEQKIQPQQQDQQHLKLSISQIRQFNNILEMTNNELFAFLKEHEGKRSAGAYPMFSIEKIMTVPRHLDVWVKDGIIREASTNYIRYATDNENGARSRRAFRSIAWMLQTREKLLETATNFILRYHHNFFWGAKKRLIPVSIKGAIDYINRRLEYFFLNNPVSYAMFYRVIKNKTISVEDKEYSMRFFFTTRKAHPHDIEEFFKKILESCPKKSSDQRLSEKFYEEFGYPLARRTVAKYRKELQIPPLHKRK